MLPRDIFQNHRHIGLDLDETLASTMSGLVEYAHSVGKLLHLSSIEDIRSHDAAGFDLTMTAEEVGSLWEAYGRATLSPTSVSPVEQSLEGVRRLHIIGKEISIITARSNQHEWKVHRTQNWVQSYFEFLDQDAIYFVNHFSESAKPKSEICKQFGVTLMIDDAIENAHDLCQSGIDCILLEKPWNRDSSFEHPLLYRVKGWGEILTNLDGNV